MEKDPFCNKILAKHWPGVKRYEDIRAVKGKDLKPVDLVCGGPPCQPASIAGKRKGTEDDRWLWPEALRIVFVLHPAWCLFENPTGILSLQGGLSFEHVLLAMEDEGYEVSTFTIPACAIGAPHRRDRVWIFAHAINSGMRRRNNGSAQRMQSPLQTEGSNSNAVANPNRFNGNNGRHGTSKIPQFQKAEVSRRDSSNSDQQRLQIGEMFRRNISEKFSPAFGNSWAEYWYEAATRLCRVDDGLSRGMDRYRTKRLKALGNSVVPQIVEILGKMIMEIESTS